MTPQKLVEHHVNILSYFEGIKHLNVEGTQKFSIKELKSILILYQRRNILQRLEPKLEEEKKEISKLKETRTKINNFFLILHEHLYNDEESLVNPYERDRLLGYSDIKLNAYKSFLKYTSGEDNYEGQSLLKNNIESQIIPLQLTKISSGETKTYLDSIPLDQKVTAYTIYTYFLNHFDNKIEETNKEIESIQHDLNLAKLDYSEISALNLFEQGKHVKYSPSAYFAAYTNSIWALIKDFLIDLHKKGIKVEVKVNI